MIITQQSNFFKNVSWWSHSTAKTLFDFPWNFWTSYYDLWRPEGPGCPLTLRSYPMWLSLTRQVSFSVLKLLSDFLCLTQALPSARSFFPFVGALVRRSNCLLVIFLCSTSQNLYYVFLSWFKWCIYISLIKLTFYISFLSHHTCLAGNSISVIIKVFFLCHGSIYEPYVTFQVKGRSSVSTSLTCENNTGHLSS